MGVMGQSQLPTLLALSLARNTGPAPAVVPVAAPVGQHFFGAGASLPSFGDWWSPRGGGAAPAVAVAPAQPKAPAQDKQWASLEQDFKALQAQPRTPPAQPVMTAQDAYGKTVLGVLQHMPKISIDQLEHLANTIPATVPVATKPISGPDLATYRALQLADMQRTNDLAAAKTPEDQRGANDRYNQILMGLARAGNYMQMPTTDGN